MDSSGASRPDSLIACPLCHTWGKHEWGCVGAGCPHDNADWIGADPATGDPVYRCIDCRETFVVRRAYVNDLEESYAEPE